MEITFEAAMEEIVASIKAAGYDPYQQLMGYATSGRQDFITRSGGAREKVKKLDRIKVKAYAEGMCPDEKENY